MNKKKRAALATGLAVAVPFALAPNASAGMRDVQQNITGADAALERAAGLVAKNQDAAAALALAQANVKTRVANRHAKALERRGQVSKANRLVALQFSENASAGLELLGDLAPVTQGDVAELVDNALRGRDRAVSVLTGLLEQVAEQARPAIASAIAAIGLDGGDQAEAIGDLVEEGGVSPDAASVLEEVTARLTAALTRIESVLAGVIDQLPPEAQAKVGAALEQVTGLIEGILGDLGDIFDGLPIGGLPIGGLPIPPIGGGGPPFGSN